MEGTTITNSDLRQSNIVEANLNETHWTGTNDLREAVIDSTQGENIKVEGVMYLQGAKLNTEMTSILKSPNIHSALDFSLRKEVSNFLQNYLPPIQKEFSSINRIGLFGSVAKGTNIKGSDLDFVVDTGKQVFYEEDKEQLRELLSEPLKQNFPSINPTDPLKDLYILQELTEKGESYIDEIHWINSL
jgi:predicted nucleotidyltransferase